MIPQSFQTTHHVQSYHIFVVNHPIVHWLPKIPSKNSKKILLDSFILEVHFAKLVFPRKKKMNLRDRNEYIPEYECDRIFRNLFVFECVFLLFQLKFDHDHEAIDETISNN